MGSVRAREKGEDPKEREGNGTGPVGGGRVHVGTCETRNSGAQSVRERD